MSLVGEPRELMEAMFSLAADQLLPTTGQMAGLNREELRGALIDLWEHGFLRWVDDRAKDELRPEIVQEDGTWEPIVLPGVH